MDGRWSSLPRDILGVITERLSSNLMDILRLRAVCSSWRSSIPSSKNSPFQVPPIIPTSSTLDPDEIGIVFKQKSLLLIYPCDNESARALPQTPWIIQVMETGPNKLSFLHLFEKGEAPDHINFLDYKITEINRSYYADFGDPMIKKVILITNGKKEIHDNGNFSAYTDMILLKYRIYGIHENNGGFGLFDGLTERVFVGECPKPVENGDWHPRFCMEEYNGKLYLVTCCVESKTEERLNIKLSIYVWNDEGLDWEPSYDLGGGILVVNHNIKLFMSPNDIDLWCCGDSVYLYGVLCYQGPDLHTTTTSLTTGSAATNFDWSTVFKEIEKKV